METLIKFSLADFLNSRTDRFRNVTEQQKKEWAENVKKQIFAMLNDTDIFYENKPDSVVEHRPVV